MSDHTPSSGPQAMTPSEAFVETLAANGVTEMFGIMGSAFMDAMDIFAPAGIRLIPVVHEQGAGHMADGYARVSGRHGVVIGQNGPGITVGHVAGVFDPPIEFYRPLPPLAYLPLIIIWFGIGEFSKVFLIYLAIFAPLAIAARSGVRSVSIEQIHAAYSMGASRTQVVLYVILKSALPEIFTGMRIGIGVGWTTLVAAEMVASTSGLGFMVLNAAEFLASDVVIMGIIVIGFFALCFDLLMRHLERVLVPWKGKV